MKISIKPRQTIDTTCIQCGAAISKEASSAHMQVCLICYARQLNDRFRQNRFVVGPQVEREETPKVP